MPKVEHPTHSKERIGPLESARRRHEVDEFLIDADVFLQGFNPDMTTGSLYATPFRQLRIQEELVRIRVVGLYDNRQIVYGAVEIEKDGKKPAISRGVRIGELPDRETMKIRKKWLKVAGKLLKVK